MSFFRSIFRNQMGMSMAEMAIAAGLAGGAALGVASLMKSMGGTGKDAESVVERTEFVSAMGVFLNSANGCYAFRTGSIVTDVETPYVISDWIDPIAKKSKSFKFDGEKNFHSNMDLKLNNIKTLTVMKTDIAGLNPITVNEGGVDKTLKKAMIRVNLSITDKSNERDPVIKRSIENSLPEAKFEYNIPVLVNGTTNAIEVCGDLSSMAESCFILQGKFDNDTGKCVLPESCKSFGSYATVDCEPKFAGVSCVDNSHGTPYNNPVTGAQSCPVGSVALSTGGDNWYRNIDCGKKCEARVNFSIGYYSCLQCD